MKQYLAFVMTITLLQALFVAPAQAGRGYYQNPALHKNQLVFMSDSDLWLFDLSANDLATRLTSHTAVEENPQISPDGERLAFVADYNGIDAIFVMPMSGGISQQVTFENRPVRLITWADDQHIIYSTQSATGMHASYALKMLNLSTHKLDVLPVSDAIEGIIDSNKEWLYFTQFGLQVSADNANFYQGGGAGELWKFNLNSDQEAVQLTADHQGSTHTPMLYRDRLFFISNQEGIDNLWSMALDGSDQRQHTNYTDFAVRHAYINNDTIVFQHGADIRSYQLQNEQDIPINLSIRSDFASMQPRVIQQPLTHFSQAKISPMGDKLAVIARGELAIAFANEQRLVNIAKPGTARFRHPVISNDGQQVYVISDQSGESEIWQYPADGSVSAKQLTNDGEIWRTGLWLSPSGNYLLNTDKRGSVFILDIKKQNNRKLKDNISGGLSGVSFSDDGRFIAMGITERGSERSRIFLYDTKRDKGTFVTSGKYISHSPAFSQDGHWLYFLSERHFIPTPSSPWGDRNMGAAFDKRTQIFAVSLTGTEDFAFAPISEIKQHNENDKDIEWEGLSKRLWQVNVPPANYSTLMVSETHLFVLEDKTLKSIKMEHGEKPKDLTDNVSDFQWSSDRSALLIQKGTDAATEFLIIPAGDSLPADLSKHRVQLSNWQMLITPELEFQQLFHDAWLMHRDSFYDANMRGVNWEQTRGRYLPLVERITERSELNDIFEQMMGELNSLHSQVRGGDIEESDNMLKLSTLGGVFADTDAGVMITHIYAYDSEIVTQAPALARPGVNARVGDVIKAINGREVDTIKTLQDSLRNQAGLQVLLTLQRGRQTVDTIVIPDEVSAEVRLRYQDWVARNNQKVAQASANIGYIHLYAMGANDLASFAREFYAQYDKPALIIDVRRNRGGNIDSMIIEKLMRRVWSFWQTPTGEQFTNMQQTFRGHMVVLADQFTYSDGETFTAGIKALNIAPVIGKQTAGAGVWLSGGNRLTDGGIARVAEFPVYSLEGHWITEARGISPDIEVTNLPHATFNGKDSQLSAAIEYLLDELQQQPILPLEAKPFPAVSESGSDIH